MGNEQAFQLWIMGVDHANPQISNSEDCHGGSDGLLVILYLSFGIPLQTDV